MKTCPTAFVTVAVFQFVVCLRASADDKAATRTVGVPHRVIIIDNGRRDDFNWRRLEYRNSFALINDVQSTDMTFDGVVPLFDGKTLTGWTQRGGKAKYAVEDGMIVGTTAPNTTNSFLCTDKEYGDFILELDFKVDPALNSGVQIRSQCFDKPTTVKSGDDKNKNARATGSASEIANGSANESATGSASATPAGDKEIKIPAGRVHGYQCEIDMDAKKARWWTAGIYDEGRREWLYPGQLGGDKKTFTDQGAKLSKPNEWNHLRIEAVGDSIRTWLNGQPRAEIKDSMTPKGFIALQVHAVGDRQEPLHVYFKNIRIKELSPKQETKDK